MQFNMLLFVTIYRLFEARTLMNPAMTRICMAPLEMLLPSSAAVAPNHLVATGGKRPGAAAKSKPPLIPIPT